MKRFYILMMMIGTALPLYFFVGFFVERGFDLPLLAQSAFANRAASGFTADLLLTALIFLVFASRERRRLRIDKQWLVFAATFLVGVSLALPLFLYLRELRLGAERSR